MKNMKKLINREKFEKISLTRKNINLTRRILKRIVQFFKRRRTNLHLTFKYHSYETLINTFVCLFVCVIVFYFVNQIHFEIEFWLLGYIPILTVTDPVNFIFSLVKFVLQVWFFCAYEYYGLYNYIIFYGLDNIITGGMLYYIDWVDYQYKHLTLPKK